MSTDVKSVRITASGVAIPERTRVRTVQLTGSAGAGSLTLTDGPAGPVLLQLDVLPNDAPSVLIPENGILFGTSVNATVAGLTSAVLFYG